MLPLCGIVNLTANKHTWLHFSTEGRYETLPARPGEEAGMSGSSPTEGKFQSPGG